MQLMKSCCCCCTLKIGTYLCAAYTLLLSTISFVFIGLTSLQLYKDDVKIDGPERNTYIKLIVATVVFTLWMLFAILLVVGCIKKSKNFLLPWVIWTILIEIFCIYEFVSYLIIVIFGDSSTVEFGNAVYVYMASSIVIIVMNIYAILCAISYYLELKQYW
ncbi:unnamed protein product [Owenia fusiformis]|uniref:Uncharacterized protein n=1 Tax=Owenia fusiformis TaxID=6347 RepID=A0A8J1YDL7_OWEFU|nr:unnamed protein product [Owenia fusiformis]